MRLAACMQGAPFILVGCRLMSHMHLLVHVCVQVSGCVRTNVCHHKCVSEEEMLKCAIMYDSVVFFSFVYLPLQ